VAFTTSIVLIQIVCIGSALAMRMYTKQLDKKETTP
jgi:hypothetical protein